MKTKILVAAMAMAFSSGTALAQSYQIEAGASYTHNSPDNGSSDGSVGARGEYHLTPVQTRNHPLAEAAFLEQSTNVYAEAADDFDWLTVGGELYIPDTMFYVGAAVVRTDYGESDTQLQATLGVTPLEGLRVTTTFTDDGYDPNVSAKYVAGLGGGNYVNVEAEIQERDLDDYFRVGADFYFNRDWSVGAAYADDFGDEFTLRTRKFFSSELSGQLAFTDTDWGHRIMFGGSLRF